MGSSVAGSVSSSSSLPIAPHLRRTVVSSCNDFGDLVGNLTKNGGPNVGTDPLAKSKGRDEAAKTLEMTNNAASFLAVIKQSSADDANRSTKKSGETSSLVETGELVLGLCFIAPYLGNLFSYN